MSILENKLTRIGKKLETTKMPNGDFPYKFGTTIMNKFGITITYLLFGGGLAYMTFITNNKRMFATLLGEENIQYSIYLQILVLLIFTALYLTHLLANIKISRTEISFPTLYNFSKKKVAIEDIKRITFTETITVFKGLSLLSDIFTRAFSAVEASLNVDNVWHTFKLTSKELKIIRVLQELKPDQINNFFFNLDENSEEN